MTHDELLAYINEEVEVCDPGCNSHKAHNQPWQALRAVVELHMPDIPYGLHEAIEACPIDGDVYPCSTIQAIEKELQ